MRGFYRILSLLLVLPFVFCGCSNEAGKKVEKVFPQYKCDFSFDDINVCVSLAENTERINVSNSFDNTVLSLYQALETDKLIPCEKPEEMKEKNMISLEFGSFLSRAGAETSPRFSLTSDDVFVFDKDKEKQYFKAKSGTYSEISAKFDSLLKEKNAFYKENEDQDKKTLALLKTDGSVFKEIEFSGDAVIYKKNVLLLLDKEKRTRCYYDREKSVLSGETCQISDYLEGYICFAEEKQIKLASVLDKNFLYEVKQFEKPLSDTDDPFVSLIFIDKNTVEVSYYTDQKELHSQKIDLSAFYKDYEDKKAKAAAAASNPKPKAPENTNKYEYISPSYSTANGIKPFAEIEAKIKGLDNTRKGYGWKGSENRQSYYSQYNAYATGNRNKNVVYLTFDEGYEFNENTTKILNILAAKNVKAVFFVTMDFAKKRPDLVKRMINEGHIVGNHSTTHPVFPDISLQSGYNEILNLHNYILNNFGYTMNLFRFPEGASSDRTLALVSEMGYASVFWNCAYNDWDTSNQPSQNTTRALVANNTQNGTIYLFHAVSNTNVSMLAEIIDTVRSSGYEFGLFGK